MKSRERFLCACRGEQVDRPPVWMMRQAGRSLPEYRALREKHGFWEVMTTPELAAEVTLQPVRRFPIDAAILFCDILVIPAALGMEVQFTPKLSVSPVVRDRSDVDSLKPAGALESLAYVGNSLRAIREEAGEDMTVLGFAGAPYTIASYMVEGGSSKSFHKLKGLMYNSPDTYDSMIDKVVDLTADYLEMQLESGADAVQLFDSWAGELNITDYRRFALPAVQRIIERVSRKGAPVIYFLNGVGNLLEAANECGAQVLGIDWRVDLATVRKRLGDSLVVQGNLDPAVLFAPSDVIKKKTNAMLNQTGGRGHIANLGHGVMPDTPISGIETFLAAIAQWAEENQ